MKTKRTYRTTDVEAIDTKALIESLSVGCIVAIDVAKTKMVFAVASSTGEVARLVRFEHPRQTGAFLELLTALRDAGLEPVVAMEPTGTYGDALRHQCHVRHVPVQMIAPKHTHDFAEVLDGVPSMHDAKAAVVLARLAAYRRSKSWQPEEPRRRAVRALVDRREPISAVKAIYQGQLESMIARHWPELWEFFDVGQTVSALAMLSTFPGPEAVARSSASELASFMQKTSRNRYSLELGLAVHRSAVSTFGSPMVPSERDRLKSIAEQIQETEKQIGKVDAEIAKYIEQDDELRQIASVVGPVCAAAIGGHVGSLRAFASAAAVEKAMGLNLRERSSGETKGTLHITKRGPSGVRQQVYLATLRLIQNDPLVRAWYRARKSYQSDEKTKHKAVVAVMRKLVSALFHVARGEVFDSTKLFDTRRLEIVHGPTHRRGRGRRDARFYHQGGLAQP